MPSAPDDDPTWILRLDEGHREAALRVAVKDLFDVAGTVTTAGCLAVARHAEPAGTDAACLAGTRQAIAAGRARLVGKTNLHELAAGLTGMNPWYGTPENPFDPDAVPGGSSSGAATAVASDQADVAFGTDTSGSVRIPAACCGVAGFRPTAGRIPTDGVWPLAPSLDTVGALARDVEGLLAAMDLLEPGFRAGLPEPRRLTVGRIRVADLGVEVDPAIDRAVDAALAALGLPVVELRPPSWGPVTQAGLDIVGAESTELHLDLVRRDRAGVGNDVVANFAYAAGIGHQRLRQARARVEHWKAEVSGFWDAVGVLACPTLPHVAPQKGPDAGLAVSMDCTMPASAAGLPALALPLPLPHRDLPASIQLMAPPGDDGLLLGLGAALEAAVGTGAP